MKDLDAISTEHPIFVLYVNGHVGAANKMAFQLAKIRAMSANFRGAHFGRGSDGELNGLIYEQPALFRFIDIALPHYAGTGRELARLLCQKGGVRRQHDPARTRHR